MEKEIAYEEITYKGKTYQPYIQFGGWRGVYIIIINGKSVKTISMDKLHDYESIKSEFIKAIEEISV
jgi:hypothetical protein